MLLGALTWEVTGVDLAGPGPRLSVILDGPDGRLAGTATPGLFGTLAVAELGGRALPGLIAETIGLPGMTFTGSVEVSDVALVVGNEGVRWESGLDPTPHLVGERARALDVLARGGLVFASAASLAEGMPPAEQRPPSRGTSARNRQPPMPTGTSPR